MQPAILIIEDDPRWYRQFKTILEQIGCSVEVAENHEKANTLLEKSEYDLVLLDVCLNGSVITLEDQLLWEFLKNEYPDLPVVAVTGWPLGVEWVWKLAKSDLTNFVDLISKGNINLRDFRHLIQSALQKKTSNLPTLPIEQSREIHSMFTPEQQAAWLILQKAFTLVSEELKQRWQFTREKTKSTETSKNPEIQPSVSEALQANLMDQLKSIQNDTQLKMMRDNLETAINMAERYNHLRNKYRLRLPIAMDSVPIEIQIEEAERERDKAIAEIKAIFEELTKEDVVIENIAD